MISLGTYDVVFISYHELNAEENHQRVLKKAPWCQRIDGVKGMARAYRKSAEMARTPSYFLIDGDSFLLDEFDLQKVRPANTPNDLLVWQAINPINNLVYGYGGIKLVGADVMRNIDESKLDFIASDTINVLFIKEVASITAFNCSPYGAWKAGFRECCMLTLNRRFRIKEAQAEQLIDVWCTRGEDKPFGSWAIKGAQDGVAYSIQCNCDLSLLHKINDSNWLKNEFDRKYRETVY